MRFLTLFFFGLSWLGLVANANNIDLQRREAGNLTQVTDFGNNTSGALMYIYVPVNLAEDPAIVVAIHYCFGTAELYYTESPYATLAEEYGFIVIFPQSPYDGTCWDVSSQAALVHGGGGDSESIVNMVTYTIDTYGADSSRVYVTGSSSGGMMTNVLCAAYPDIFAAGIVYSGVAPGCFVAADGTADYWNSTCALGDTIDTQEQWTNVVESMYPGYTGTYPKVQVYHGSVDYYIYPQNWNESVKTWTGVFDYALNSYTLNANFPLANYYTYDYGENFQGIYAIGVGHTVPIQGDRDMVWFGFAADNTTAAEATSVSAAGSAATSAIGTTSEVVAAIGSTSVSQSSTTQSLPMASASSILSVSSVAVSSVFTSEVVAAISGISTPVSFPVSVTTSPASFLSSPSSSSQVVLSTPSTVQSTTLLTVTSAAAPTSSAATHVSQTFNTVSTSVEIPTATSTSTNSGGSIPLYGQCGGENWTGETTCEEGTCVVQNDWYSQCVSE